MSDLIPFDYGREKIRVVSIDGVPWFIAADVCMVLGIRDTYDATRGLDDDEKGTDSIRTPGGQQSVTTVSESGLYSLILRSRKPQAKQFKRWITHEVIPSIRKTGSYGEERQLPQTFADALELAARQHRELESTKAQVAELEPAAHSWETLVGTPGDYSMRDAAQILDRDPAIQMGQNRLARYLRETGWTCGKGKPYQHQVDCGRLASRVLSFEHPHTGEPQLSSQVRITPKGIQELHKRLGGERPLRLDLHC